MTLAKQFQAAFSNRRTIRYSRDAMIVYRVLQERLRYDKRNPDGERWITINGGDGGGTPVKVDGKGNITGGPKALADKCVTKLSDFSKKEPAKKDDKPQKSKPAKKNQLPSSKDAEKAADDRVGPASNPHIAKSLAKPSKKPTKPSPADDAIDLSSMEAPSYTPDPKRQPVRQPRTPLPVRPPEPVKHIRDTPHGIAFDAAFSRVDKQSGGRNFLKISDLRKALPQYSREEFDQHLRQLRLDGHFAANSAQGGVFPIDDETREGGIKEGSSNLVLLSRKGQGGRAPAEPQSAAPSKKERQQAELDRINEDFRAGKLSQEQATQQIDGVLGGGEQAEPGSKPWHNRGMSSQEFEGFQKMLGIKKPSMGPAGHDAITQALSRRPGGEAIAAIMQLGSDYGWNRNDGTPQAPGDAVTRAIDGKYTAEELLDAAHWAATSRERDGADRFLYMTIASAKTRDGSRVDRDAFAHMSQAAKLENLSQAQSGDVKKQTLAAARQHRQKAKSFVRRPSPAKYSLRHAPTLAGQFQAAFRSRGW